MVTLGVPRPHTLAHVPYRTAVATLGVPCPHTPACAPHRAAVLTLVPQAHGLAVG